jgi:hypothetical protein
MKANTMKAMKLKHRTETMMLLLLERRLMNINLPVAMSGRNTIMIFG